MSANILISSHQDVSTAPNTLEIRFPISYNSVNDQIALQSLSMYYSWFNVSTYFNNRTFSYVWVDGSTNNVTVPEGFYTIDLLNQYLEFVFRANGHYLVNATGKNVYFLELVLNSVYYSTTLDCRAVPLVTLPTSWTNPASVPLNGKVPQIVFDTSEFNLLLGYPQSVSYPPTLGTTEFRYNSTQTPIISPVTAINVSCSWVSDGRFSNYPSVIGTFVPDAQFGSLLSFTPQTLLHYPVMAKNYTGITIAFYDQRFRPLQILDTNQISISLALESKPAAR